MCGTHSLVLFNASLLILYTVIFSKPEDYLFLRASSLLSVLQARSDHVK